MAILRNSDKRLPQTGERVSHLACSLYLFDPSKRSVLLVKHNGLGVWLPPGGHVDEGELPHVAALREALEETNMQDILLLDVKAGDLQLRSEEGQRQLRFRPETGWEEGFLEPFALVEERIPETVKDVEHFHVDYVYVGQLRSLQEARALMTEVSDAQWVELRSEVIDELETFPNVRRILGALQGPRE